MNHTPPRRLRVALVQMKDARDVRTNSGIPFFSKRAFEQHVGEVIDLSPAPISLLPYRALGKVASTLTRRKAPYIFDRGLSRRLGAYFTRLLREGDYDIVFCPFSNAALPHLDTELPIVYLSDITWRLARNYYECYTDVLSPYDRAADEIERSALNKASLVLLPSYWSQKSAIEDYGVSPERAPVFYLGANIIEAPAREAVLPRKLKGPVKLLLAGVDWEIKGGALALETLRILLDRGVDAQLTVVGCHAPEGVTHERMTVIPFLNKSIPEERERFERLWYEADFYLHPTRFEAAGLVLCEAGAYGLPALATDTGGIPSLVRNGENGYTLPRNPTAFADAVSALVAEPERYAQLCETSRDTFETRLNWDVWGKRVAEQLLKQFPEFAGRIGVAGE